MRRCVRCLLGIIGMFPDARRNLVQHGERLVSKRNFSLAATTRATHTSNTTTTAAATAAATATTSIVISDDVVVATTNKHDARSGLLLALSPCFLATRCRERLWGAVVR
jgi:hypothetical protein